MANLEFHPLANLFPLLEGAEFEALVADIREHGLREPVVLHEGQILDGRNRYRACEAAGVELLTEQWDQRGTAQAYVVSKNLHRRHLNESQRAMVAAKLATLSVGRPKNETVEISTISFPAAEAAEMLNVNRHTVFSAKRVLADGTPEEIAAVEKGEAAVSTVARQIRAKMPPDKRAKKRAEPMSQAGKNPERIQRLQLNAEIWGRIREALGHLTSLPLPIEAAAIARVNDRTNFVTERLPKAIQWITEFSDAWNGNE